MEKIKLAVQERKVAEGKKVEKKEEKPILPFITKKSRWAPVMSTDEAGVSENLIGYEYAFKYIELLKRGGHDATDLSLSPIIGAMAKTGRYGGIEIGFVSFLGDVLDYCCKSVDIERLRDKNRSKILWLLSTEMLPKAEKLRMLKTLKKLDAET